MLRSNVSLTLGIVVVGCGVALSLSRAQEATDEKLRLGTYDNRAVAMAWAASKHNPAGEKMKEFKQAVADGDRAKARQLREWGEMRQRLLHFQGFGKYPVDDYVKLVKGKLPEVMARHDLAAIVWMCHIQADHVELVDVTADLMKLLGASDELVQKAEGLRKHDPVDFATLFKMDPKD